MISYIYSVIFLIFTNYPIVFIFVLLFLYHDLSSDLIAKIKHKHFSNYNA